MRARTQQRILRNRARHRATALLIQENYERFLYLMEQEFQVATIEASVLATMTPAERGVQAVTADGKDGEIVLLRPGPSKPGQTIVDRVDVARCTRCQTSHDNGHTCPHCGWRTTEADWKQALETG